MSCLVETVINHFMAADTGDDEPWEVTFIGSWAV